jgi:predicted O-methyltransferase YrrM
MLRRFASASRLILRHGPRAVHLAREAKNRGAAQKKGELRPFISLLRKQTLSTVVELGTYRGGTLWLWCQLAEPDALIVSIDLPGGEFGGGYDDPQAQRIRSYARANQELVLIRADSHLVTTRDELDMALGGRPIDFLFIDADHTYEGVKQDYEMYAPLVRPGGVVAFHDILPHTTEERCKVDVFWEELKREGIDVFEEFVERDTRADGRIWGGIGALVAR